MTNSPHEIVLAFLAAFHDSPDFDTLGAFFADDGYYQPLVPTTAARHGRHAIVDVLRTQYRTYYDCRCEIHGWAENGHVVFTERSDHVTLYAGDRKVSSRVCAVFEVDGRGQIAAWREYWDTGDISKQMELDVSQVLTATVG